MILVLQARGLSLPQVGVAMAVWTGSAALLELPTGGLADTWGRRPVLMTASALFVVLNAGLLVLEGPSLIALMAVGGAARALDSGPLEAWAIDSLEADDTDGRESLVAVGQTTDAASLAGGALAGGLLVALGVQVNGEALLLPVAVATVLQVVHLLLLRVLLGQSTASGDVPAADTSAGWADTIRRGVASALGDRVLLVVILAYGGVGVGLVAVEILTQPRVSSVLAVEQAGPLLGVMLALAFAGTSAGASIAVRAARAVGGHRNSIVIAHVVSGVGLLAMGASRNLVTLAVGFIAFYALLGVAGPSTNTMIHQRVGSDVRATMLSVQSLVFFVGGVGGSLLLPAIAAAWSIGWAYGLAGLLVLATTLPLRVFAPAR